MLLHEIKELGTYVAVQPTDATLALLQAWALEHKLALDPELHVTLLYSKKTISPELLLIDHIATPIGFEKFNTALVVEIECQTLSDRHDQLIALGGTHDYPSYRPHMTLMAEAGEFKLEDIPEIPFRLTFNKEKISANAR